MENAAKSLIEIDDNSNAHESTRRSNNSSGSSGSAHSSSIVGVI